MSASNSLDIKHWTDLPESIDSTFVSIPGDYDYPHYISEKGEWVHKRNFKGRMYVTEPFLIRELNRFVPYLDNNYVRFHILNMPGIIIGRIEIMGFVVAVAEDVRFHKYQVDDGTGTITIYYDKKKFANDNMKRKTIDEKYMAYASQGNFEAFKGKEFPKSFPDPRPNFNYPQHTSIRNKAILEHNWSLETKNGLLGKYIRRRDYVHAVGYCNMDFMFRKKPTDEITLKDLSLSKITFFAMNVSCITEHAYNAKLFMWINKFVRIRYDEDPNKPELVPDYKSWLKNEDEDQDEDEDDE
ncbi:uncharacterized protein LOC117227607 [Megalopta genalis]|uniref:uncharacterized protein LOC117227607 n=1 Tax=Megalopta genalis TaxID=115081 RepID=UPI003FD37AC7